MKEKTNIPKMVWRIAKPYHTPLIISSILAMLVVFLEMYIPLYFTKYFDLLSLKSVQQIGIDEAYKILTLICIILFIRFLARRTQDFIYDYYCSGLEVHFYKHAYDAALSKDHEFFTNNFTGTIAQSIRKFGRGSSAILYQTTNVIAPFIVTWVTIIILLSKFDITYTIIFSIFAVIFIAFTIPYVKWRKKFGEDASNQDTKLTGHIADSISNYNAIELYANQNYERQKLNEIAKNIKRLRFRDWASWDVLFALQAFLLYIMEITILVFATKDFFAGAVSIGFLILLRTYYGRIIGLLFEIANIFRIISDSFVDIKDTIKLLGSNTDKKDNDKKEDLIVHNGEIVFNHVEFSYPNNTKNQLTIEN